MYLFVPISAYNYFYMIEIIRVARSIIPAIELTFLSLHMYLYSKAGTCLCRIKWRRTSVAYRSNIGNSYALQTSTTLHILSYNQWNQLHVGSTEHGASVVLCNRPYWIPTPCIIMKRFSAFGKTFTLFETVTWGKHSSPNDSHFLTV